MCVKGELVLLYKIMSLKGANDSGAVVNSRYCIDLTEITDKEEKFL